MASFWFSCDKTQQASLSCTLKFCCDFAVNRLLRGCHVLGCGDIKLFRVNGIYVWDISVSHTNRTRFNEGIRFLRFIYYFPALKKSLPHISPWSNNYENLWGVCKYMCSRLWLLRLHLVVFEQHAISCIYADFFFASPVGAPLFAVRQNTDFVFRQKLLTFSRS